MRISSKNYTGSHSYKYSYKEYFVTKKDCFGSKSLTVLLKFLVVTMSSRLQRAVSFASFHPLWAGPSGAKKHNSPPLSVTWFHGSYFSGTKLSDISSIFFQKFFNGLFFFKLKTRSILANNTQLILISLKIMNNICLRFPDFSSTWCDFPWLFPFVQNSQTGKCLHLFPGFSVPVGTLHKSKEWFGRIMLR